MHGGGGTGKANTGIKFHSNFEEDRGEKDSLEDIFLPLQDERFLLPPRKTISFPLPSLVPNLPPRASPPYGTSSAPPSSLPQGMWKPLPAAELFHLPLLVSCLSVAHTSDSQTHLTLCRAANRSSRQAAAEGTAEQLLSAKAWDTG